MECGRTVLILCLWLASAMQTEARSFKRISPSLDPESSKKFFKKDYPNDSRPGVDVLHFKHPYPVVQDSGDFDADFVKDENSDNGNWKAQQEYDRLRHKLTKEKLEADKALVKKREEEEELKHAMKKLGEETAHKNAVDAAKKQIEAAQKTKKDNDEAKSNEGQGWSWSWDWWPFSWPKSGSESKPAPKVAEEGTGVRSATKDTEKAMTHLEDCQEELAKARAELKKVMDELEGAKAKQTQADSALSKATAKQMDAEKLSKSLHEKTNEEQAEHATSEAAYLKQKAVVDKMKADLDIAAAKVKAFRDAEDKGGGVYNTHTPKSFAMTSASPTMLALLLTGVATWQFA